MFTSISYLSFSSNSVDDQACLVMVPIFKLTEENEVIEYISFLNLLKSNSLNNTKRTGTVTHSRLQPLIPGVEQGPGVEQLGQVGIVTHVNDHVQAGQGRGVALSYLDNLIPSHKVIQAGLHILVFNIKLSKYFPGTNNIFLQSKEPECETVGRVEWTNLQTLVI